MNAVFIRRRKVASPGWTEAGPPRPPGAISVRTLQAASVLRPGGLGGAARPTQRSGTSYLSSYLFFRKEGLAFSSIPGGPLIGMSFFQERTSFLLLSRALPTITTATADRITIVASTSRGVSASCAMKAPSASATMGLT